VCPTSMSNDPSNTVFLEAYWPSNYSFTFGNASKVIPWSPPPPQPSSPAAAFRFLGLSGGAAVGAVAGVCLAGALAVVCAFFLVRKRLPYCSNAVTRYQPVAAKMELAESMSSSNNGGYDDVPVTIN
jgi:hypothetical protein